MSNWVSGEAGPACLCGKPTIIIAMGDEYGLMCFAHTKRDAAMFTLPQTKPDNWDTPSREELDALLSSCNSQEDE